MVKTLLYLFFGTPYNEARVAVVLMVVESAEEASHGPCFTHGHKSNPPYLLPVRHHAVPQRHYHRIVYTEHQLTIPGKLNKKKKKKTKKIFKH